MINSDTFLFGGRMHVSHIKYKQIYHPQVNGRISRIPFGPEVSLWSWRRWYPREVWKIWGNPQCVTLDFLGEFWYGQIAWKTIESVCPDSNHQRQPVWKVKGLWHLGWSLFGESCDEWERYLRDGWSLKCSRQQSQCGSWFLRFR